jgi:DNA-binding transcriptional regulator YiaG
MPGSPDIPKLLKAWRKKRGHTQDAAAAELGVPVGTLRDWEQARSTPRGLAAKALLDAIR